jgi:hypothetical protein
MMSPPDVLALRNVLYLTLVCDDWKPTRRRRALLQARRRRRCAIYVGSK